MNTRVVATPCWSTASFGESVEMSQRDVAALGKHLAVCKSMAGRLFEVRCMADAVHHFLAARFVTTLVAVTLVIGLVSLIN